MKTLDIYTLVTCNEEEIRAIADREAMAKRLSKKSPCYCDYSFHAEGC